MAGRVIMSQPAFVFPNITQNICALVTLWVQIDDWWDENSNIVQTCGISVLQCSSLKCKVPVEVLFIVCEIVIFHI